MRARDCSQTLYHLSASRRLGEVQWREKLLSAFASFDNECVDDGPLYAIGHITNDWAYEPK